jgi:hypothetical protein
MAFNRRALLALVLLLAAVLIVGLPLLSRRREPHADGKRLSHWLRELKIGVKVATAPDGSYTVMLPNLSDQELSHLSVLPKIKQVSSNMASSRFFTNWPDQVDFYYKETLDNDPAARAIKSIGVKALPYLRARLHTHESTAKALFCQRVWPHLPQRLRQWLGKPIHPVHMRANSAYALGILGAAAWPEVTELQNLLQNDEDYLVRSVAREALHRISPEIAGPFYPELFEQPQPIAPEPHSENTNSPHQFSTKLVF